MTRLGLGWARRFLPVVVVVIVVAIGGLLGIYGAGAASGFGAARVSYEVPQFAPIGARTVWAVTLAGSTNHPSQRVLRSVDGGARWSDVTPPGLPRAGTATSLFSVDFASATWAWLAGSETRGRSALLVTSDGGRSWTRVGRAPPCKPQFINHVDAWCTALRIGSLTSPRFSTVLYRTTDGGRSWRQVWHSAGLVAPAVSFTSPELGFFSSAGGSLYRTDDGGSRWQRQLTLPAYSPLAAADPPAVIGDAHSEAFGAPAGNHNGLSAAFYRSNDAGEHWTRVNPPGRPNVDAIDVVTPRIWKLQVSTRQLLSTVNAGQTWMRVTANVALPDFRLSGPQFTTTLVGWDRSLNGSGADVLRTTDGGRRWATVHVPLQ